MGARRVGATGLIVAVMTASAGLAGAQERVELPARDRPLELETEDVSSVGGAMAVAEHELFGDIGSRDQVAFDGEGNLYVFDRANYRIVVFDRDGGFVREFGKEGEGPDEWRSPFSMSVFRDGRVLVGDIGHRVFHDYAPDGERVGSIPMERGSITLGGMVPDPRGGAVYTGDGLGNTFVVSRDGSPGAPEPDGRSIERWRLDDEVTKASFYTAWEAPEEEDEGGQTLRGGNVTFRIASAGPRTFEPRLFVGVQPDGGVAVVDSSGYRVKMVGPDGSLRSVLERPGHEAREVTERLVERDKERRIAQLEEGDGPQMRLNMTRGGQAVPISDDQMQQMIRSSIEQRRYYHEIPAIGFMTAGWDGTLWIERTAEDWWEDGPVDVVTPEGDYLGTVPAEVGVPSAFGPDGLAAWVELDELDVATIRVVRLPASLR